MINATVFENLILFYKLIKISDNPFKTIIFQSVVLRFQ